MPSRVPLLGRQLGAGDPGARRQGRFDHLEVHFTRTRTDCLLRGAPSFTLRNTRSGGGGDAFHAAPPPQDYVSEQFDGCQSSRIVPDTWWPCLFRSEMNELLSRPTCALRYFLMSEITLYSGVKRGLPPKGGQLVQKCSDSRKFVHILIIGGHPLRTPRYFSLAPHMFYPPPTFSPVT